MGKWQPMTLPGLKRPFAGKTVACDPDSLPTEPLPLLREFQKFARSEGWSWAEIDAVCIEATSEDRYYLRRVIREHCRKPEGKGI